MDIKNGAVALTADTDYTVSGGTVIIRRNYLNTLNDGIATLPFHFSAGLASFLDIRVANTAAYGINMIGMAGRCVRQCLPCR